MKQIILSTLSIFAILACVSTSHAGDGFLTVANSKSSKILCRVTKNGNAINLLNESLRAQDVGPNQERGIVVNYGPNYSDFAFFHADAIVSAPSFFIDASGYTTACVTITQR